MVRRRIAFWRNLLKEVRSGQLEVDVAMKQLRLLPFDVARGYR